MFDPPLELIGPRFWNGSIAVDQGKIYLATATGELRQGDITSRPVTTKVIGPRFWDQGYIAVSDGFIYLARNGQLRRGPISIHVNTDVIGPRLWDGSIAVD